MKDIIKEQVLQYELEKELHWEAIDDIDDLLGLNYSRKKLEGLRVLRGLLWNKVILSPDVRMMLEGSGLMDDADIEQMAIAVCINASIPIQQNSNREAGHLAQIKTELIARKVFNTLIAQDVNKKLVRKMLMGRKLLSIKFTAKKYNIDWKLDDVELQLAKDIFQFLIAAGILTNDFIHEDIISIFRVELAQKLKNDDLNITRPMAYPPTRDALKHLQLNVWRQANYESDAEVSEAILDYLEVKSSTPFALEVEHLPVHQGKSGSWIVSYPIPVLPVMREVMASGKEEGLSMRERGDRWKAVMGTYDKEIAVYRAYQEICLLKNFGIDTFFLPHAMDTRGRCYSRGKFLTTQADKLVRSALIPAECNEPLEAGTISNADLHLLFKWGEILSEQLPMIKGYVNTMRVAPRAYELLAALNPKTSPISELLEAYRNPECIEVMESLLDEDTRKHYNIASNITEVDQTASSNLIGGAITGNMQLLDASNVRVDSIYQKRVDGYVRAGEIFRELTNNQLDDKCYQRGFMKDPIMIAGYGGKLSTMLGNFKAATGEKDEKGILKDNFELMLEKSVSFALVKHLTYLGKIIVRHAPANWNASLFEGVPFFPVKTEQNFELIGVATPMLKYEDNVKRKVLGTSTALPPNFIHHLDAAIVHRTTMNTAKHAEIKLSFKHNKMVYKSSIIGNSTMPFFTVHDAIISHKDQAGYFRQAMIDAFVSVVDSDPLGRFEDLVDTIAPEPVERFDKCLEGVIAQFGPDNLWLIP